MIFTIEIAEQKLMKKGMHHVEIHMDKAGIEEFIFHLRALKDRKTGSKSLPINEAIGEKIPPHIHLMSQSWGDGELTEVLQNPENTLTHHLELILVDD